MIIFIVFVTLAVFVHLLVLLIRMLRRDRNYNPNIVIQDGKKVGNVPSGEPSLVKNNGNTTLH